MMQKRPSLWQFDVLPIRLISAAVPIGFILLLFLFNEPSTHWTFLLLMSIALGYVHFVIATTYQYEGILRHPEKKKLLKWFYILATIGFTVSVVTIAAGYTLLLSLLSISYFVLHVLANEHTFLSRNNSINFPYWIMLTLVVPVGALYLVSLTHESLFYSYDLQYYGTTLTERVDIINQIIPVGWLKPLAIGSLVLFLAVVPLKLLLTYQKKVAALLFFIVGIATLLYVTVATSINFMFVLQFVLVYHFILLSLLFVKPMRDKGGAVWSTYCKRHVYLLLPILIGAGIFMYQLDIKNTLDYIFQFQVFVTLSITHITASILNEHWFKNWLLGSK